MYYGMHYNSPIGDIFLASDENNLIGLWMQEQRYREKTMPKGIIEEMDILALKQGEKWLNAYFAGKKPQPNDLPLAPIGNEFRQCVWQILKEIPYGKLMTYGDIAKEVEKRMNKERMSAQAVGGAVGHNPISIIIPCHRVIGAKGNLTGFAGGIEKKIKLLTHEGIDVGKLDKLKSGNR